MLTTRELQTFTTAIFMCAIYLGATGCGTVGNVAFERTPRVYGGVRNDAEMIGDGVGFMQADSLQPISRGGAPIFGLFLVGVGIVDMPLSLAGDSVTLPYVLIKRPQRKTPNINLNRISKPLLRSGFENGEVSVEPVEELKRVFMDTVISFSGAGYSDQIDSSVEG